MLKRRHNQHGVTLIELMVAVTIVGILFALAAPNFSKWIQNQQTRAAAESILNGIQLARSTAVKNNNQARFVLCDYTDAPIPTSSWEVLAASATAPAPSASIACQGAIPGSIAAAGDVRVQEYSSQEGSKFVKALPTIGPPAFTGANTVTFNSLGRVVTPTNPIDGSAPMAQIDVSYATWVLPYTTERPLRITVSTGGNIRMCDPQLTVTAPNDPRAC